MDRVQIAAIGLALAAFALFYLTRPSGGRVDDAGNPPRPVAVSEAPGTPLTGTETDARLDAAQEGAKSRTRQKAELRNDAVRLLVSVDTGAAESIELLAYPDRKGNDAEPVELVTTEASGTLVLSLGDPALTRLYKSGWEIEETKPLGVKLVARGEGLEIARRIELDAEGYGGWLRVAVRNESPSVVRPRLEVGVTAAERPARAPDRFPNYSLVWNEDGDVKRSALAGIGSGGFFGQLTAGGNNGEKAIAAPVEMVGADSQYFLLGVVSDNPRETQARLLPLGEDAASLSLQYAEMEVPPGTAVERSWRLYFGPKIPDLVESVDPRLGVVIAVGWGWVQPLVHIFAAVLKWLYENVVGNYGWAIVIITIVLRLATYPLTQRSMQSMKKFSAIAPQIKELQDKYAGDRPKLQEEVMKLYGAKGINPLSSLGGGCLPMLVQMPFMVALYFALQSSIDLRHAPFLAWINDLSAPEDLHLFGLPVPLRILPLAMGVSMLAQQRLTPTPTADSQQRQMMTLMSVVFVVIFYGFPSGLVLYWFVSNLLGIGQQVLVNRASTKA